MKARRHKSSSGVPSQEDALEAIGSIYEAAFDLAQWPQAMAKIAHLVDGHRALMFVPDMAGREFWAAHEVSPDMMAGYAEYYRSTDLWTERCSRYLTSPGSTILSEMVATDGEYSRSEFWNDFTRHADIFRVACAAVDIPPHTPAAGTLLCVYRPQASEHFQSTTRDVLHAVQPHVLRSLKLGRLLASLASEKTYLQAALANVSKQILAVTADARIVYANPAAERLLREADGIKVAGAGLVADTEASTAGLRSAIARAAASGSAGGRGATVQLQRPRRGGELTIDVLPLPHGHQMVPSAQSARALLIVHSPRGPGDETFARLRELYRLTSAELKLIRALMETGGLPEAASHLGIRHSTARSQIKAVFAKTQTHRQVDLLRLVHGLVS